MATTAADVLIDTIHRWGVNVVFGLPGDGINGIMEALRKRKDDIRFVQVRHEEAAASYRRALQLATNPVERSFFERRLAEVG